MSNHLLLYVGAYTDTLPHVEGQAVGITLFRYDPKNGTLGDGQVAAKVANPTYLAVHPLRQFLYAASEVDNATSKKSGKKSGRVYAYAIDATTGLLRLINWRLTHGSHPCHLQVDATGRALVVANYTGGSVISYPLGEDGSIGEYGTFVQHVGSSINPARQEAAHAHMALIDPSNRFVMVPDLGMDQVKVYQLDLASGKIQANGAATVTAGQGPRHFAFHPKRKFAYVINELGSTVTVFRYLEASGTLESLQTISTLPEDFTGNSSCAHVQVHPSGKFLYGSNRGHNSIAIFQIDAATGLLQAAGHASTAGRTPRNFSLDPDGRFLLAANQDTHTIVSFAVDQTSGALTPTGAVIASSSPVCLQFL